MEDRDVFAQKYECTADDPPFCAATCPAGTDARALMKKIAAGDFDGGYRLLEKAVLFPDILCCVCAAPCEAACRRRESGGALSIRLLEAACCRYARKGEPERFLTRPRSGRAAVIGGGLSGLACAVTLAGKGYAPTLFDAGTRLGGSLWDCDRKTLPAEVIEADTSRLLAGLPVTLRTGETVKSLADIDFDAVFVSVPGLCPPPANADTLETDTPGVFCAPPGDPLARMLAGRRAARSVERFLIGSPLSSGSEAAFTGKTRLCAPPDEEIAERVSVKPDESGFVKEQAMREAARCLDCRCENCVRSCEFLRYYRRYPKHYINDARQSLRTLKSLQAKLAARQTNACNLCGLCAEKCPNGVDMSAVYAHSRRLMSDYGNLPAAFHDFWLRDMAFSGSDEAALFRPQPGTDKSAYLFFPGCQMGGSDPRYVTETYALLAASLPGGVALGLDCCGAPAHWAGCRDLTRAHTDAFKARSAAFGHPEVILACPSCAKMFGIYHPEIRVRSLWNVLEEAARRDETVLARARAAATRREPLALFDPCASRYDAAAQTAVRRLLAGAGHAVRELPHHGRYAQCCGYGGLTYGAHPELTELTVRARTEQSDLDYVTYCTNCRDTFLHAGKRSFHVLDLLFGYEAAKKPVSLGDKRDNRRALRRRLSAAVRGEAAPPARERFPVRIDAALKARLDRDLILPEDIETVIQNAEATGAKLLTRDGAFVAHGRLGILTYWAEYAPSPDGFTLSNAWCHRMTIEAT